MENNTAIVLAAGRGSRMGGRTPKQFLELGGKPLIYYSLKAFEDFDEVSRVILVTGSEDIDYCKSGIIERYGFRKADTCIAGGAERYLSVYNGLKAAGGSPCAYVFIHDGARPNADAGILKRTLEGARRCGACTAGMKVKDTIRETDGEGFSVRTPDRSTLWAVQTPQVFRYDLVMEAYSALAASGDYEGITDDAMVVERMTGVRALMVEGSYRNIKITTPEDLLSARAFLPGAGE